jgi:hypothetical protein
MMDQQIILTVNASDKHYSKTFNCETLKFDGHAKFTNCIFPNLHFIDFDCKSDEVYAPFEDCNFSHPLNLYFNKEIICHLPVNLSVQSMRSQSQSSIFVENRNWDGPVEYYKKHDITVRVKYGEEPENYLEEYRDLYSDDLIRFSTIPPKFLTQSIRLTVISGNYILGDIMFIIDDDPFSLYVLLSQSNTLEYYGNVPLNWGDKISHSVKEKISKIRKLTVHGDLETGAFTNLNLFLRELTVTGVVHLEAFNGTWGKVMKFNVIELSEDSLVGSELDFVTVNVNKLAHGVNLEAETVFISDSRDIQGIKYAKTLIIKNKFDKPIDLKGLDITKLDYSQVDSKGPFVILNFDNKDQIITMNPQSMYLTSNNVLKGTSGQEIYSKLIEDLKSKYTDSVFTLYFNEREILSPDDIVDGEIVVKINNKRVGHYLISIETYDRYIAWGLVALTSILITHLLVI